MFSRSKKSEKPESDAAQDKAQSPHGFTSLLSKGITMQPDRVAMLKDGFKKGLDFFEKFNESRLNLAFASFDEDMKKALYEVLFLLHVNDPKFAEYKYNAMKLEHVGGTVREKPYEDTVTLYVEGAPHGVEGIDKLSPVFKEAFDAHIQEVFGTGVSPGSPQGFCPFVSISSLG